MNAQKWGATFDDREVVEAWWSQVMTEADEAAVAAAA